MRWKTQGNNLPLVYMCTLLSVCGARLTPLRWSPPQPYPKPKPSQQVRYEKDCEAGTPVATCPRNLCEDTTCDGYASAECRLNICGTCRPVFYVNGVRVYCRNDAVTRNLYFRKCPPRVSVVPCRTDPCRGRTCRNYPNAKCRVNPCGYCKPTFYVNDVLVHCAGDTDDVTLRRAETTTPCERERRRGVSRGKIGKSLPFVVNCTNDGSYESLQCWPAVGLCWCVNRKGKEIHGSRTYFPQKPNCDKITMDCRSTGKFLLFSNHAMLSILVKIPYFFPMLNYKKMHIISSHFSQNFLKELGKTGTPSLVLLFHRYFINIELSLK